MLLSTCQENWYRVSSDGGGRYNSLSGCGAMKGCEILTYRLCMQQNIDLTEYSNYCDTPGFLSALADMAMSDCH